MGKALKIEKRYSQVVEIQIYLLLNVKVFERRAAHEYYRDFLTDIDKLMPKYIGLAKSEHINHTPIV